MNEQSPYEILDLPINAPAEAVKRQYKQLIRQNPPEQNPEMFSTIRTAYDQINTELFGKRVKFPHYQKALGAKNAVENTPAEPRTGVLTTVFETPFNTHFELEKLLDDLTI